MDTVRNGPDPQKVFEAIAAILSRREGRQVRLVSVRKVEKEQKVG